jgi:hypothetical protein
MCHDLSMYAGRGAGLVAVAHDEAGVAFLWRSNVVECSEFIARVVRVS